jgi:hypothetical protein
MDDPSKPKIFPPLQIECWVPFNCSSIQLIQSPIISPILEITDKYNETYRAISKANKRKQMRINKIKEEQTDAENILVIIKKEIVGNVELGKKARGSHIQLGMDKVKDVRSYQKPLYLYDLLELNDKNKSMIKMCTQHLILR